MKRIFLGILSAIMIISLLGCSSISVAQPTDTPVIEQPNTVRLSQNIINAAVADCKDKTTWGIDLPDIHVAYLSGIMLEAAIILHNGNDVDRLVKVECSPMYETTTESETGVIYQPSPVLISRLLIPEVSTVRLGIMETKIIKVTLFVPSGIQLQGHWAVGVTASGFPIEPYTQKLIVTTQDTTDEKGNIVPDTTLTFHLDKPLLEGIKSILLINSQISESPQVKGYNSENGELTIDNLASNQKRELDITYEPMPSVATAYEQRWLISMLTEK